MKRTEKAPGRSANLTGAAGGTSGETASTANFTLDGAGRQERIFSMLPAGEENALPASHLAELCGYCDTRALRLEIDRERSRGVPVLASSAGYYRPSPGPAGIAEVKRFLRRQDARAASNRRTTNLIRARLRAIEKAPLSGQENLFDGGGSDG